MTLARDLRAAGGRSSPSSGAAVAVLFQQAPPYSMNVWLGNPGEPLRREMNRLRMEGGARLTAARAEGKRIDRELDTLLNLIPNGGHTDRVNAKMAQLEARKAALERALANSKLAIEVHG